MTPAFREKPTKDEHSSRTSLHYKTEASRSHDEQVDAEPDFGPDSASRLFDHRRGDDAAELFLATDYSDDFPWKRPLDVLGIVVSLPIIIPIIGGIVLWIRLVSRGPALFRQVRIGKHGERFVLYKFRSMHLNSGTGRHETHIQHLVQSDTPMTKLDLLCDSRLIPGGCLLRAAGLDELPQLFNVLRGEMSLVGPRPCLPQEYGFFSLKQRERFDALPGITGNWQVHGKNQSTFSEMNDLDIEYVRNSSLIQDLGIIARTPRTLMSQIRQVFRHRGQSEKCLDIVKSNNEGRNY
jgi:lipopolysaccharide/colanic/teichoic acid biosynthesis glycosyltransferase